MCEINKLKLNTLKAVKLKINVLLNSSQFENINNLTDRMRQESVIVGYSKHSNRSNVQKVNGHKNIVQHLGIRMQSI